MFSLCEYSSHFTKIRRFQWSSTEGLLAMIDSISHPASSASISATCYFGCFPRLLSNNPLLKVGWFFQDSGCHNLQYIWLHPTGTTSNIPDIFCSSFCHLLARILFPFNLASSLFLNRYIDLLSWMLYFFMASTGFLSCSDNFIWTEVR